MDNFSNLHGRHNRKVKYQYLIKTQSILPQFKFIGNEDAILLINLEGFVAT
jgi:hypothetical protein